MRQYLLITLISFLLIQGLNAQTKCKGSNAVSAAFTFSNKDCSIFIFEAERDTLKKKKFQWSFGDGTFSSKPLIEHAFLENGKYKVQLIVTGPDLCKDTSFQIVTVEKPKASFTYLQQIPGNVEFKTTKTRETYSWDFGDGSTNNNALNPFHTYTKAGIYNVTLMVQNALGCIDIIEKPISIDFTTPAAMEPTTFNFQKRTNNIIREISPEADSMNISLYDNGEIDGDSVTIIYNDKVILAHQLLSSRPVTFTLKPGPVKKENILIMYADNLGAIPPNTALMIITDGNKRYEVNVSSTDKSNGAIIFRPKDQK